MADRLRLEVLLAAIDKATGPFRKITGGATAAAEAVRKSKAALAALDKQKIGISDFARYRAQVRAIGPDLEQAQARSRALTSKLEQQRVAHQKIAGEVQAERLAIQARTKALFAGGERSAKEVMDLRAREMGLGRLEAAYKASTSELNKQKTAVRLAERDTKALSDRQRDLNERLSAAKQRLEAAGLSTDKLASHQRELRAEMRKSNEQIKLQEQAVERMQKAQARASGLKRGGMLMAAHGAGAWALKDQFAAPGTAMLSAFAEQETAANGLRTAMMGANGQVSNSYRQISSMAVDLGNKLPGTSAELLDMMTMLKRQGMSDAAILGGLGKTSAYLGAQLRMPYVESAEFVAKLQDATRTTEADMLNLGDTIQRAFYLGVNPNDMLEGFVKLSPAMDILRVEGLAATKMFSPLLTMMDQMGMKGGPAGNALRKVFQATMDTGNIKDINTLMRERGSGIRFDFTDGKGEFGGLDKFFAQIEQLKKLSTEDRLSVMGMMFGDDSETLTTVNAMIDKGKAGYDAVQRKMAAQASLQDRVTASLGTLGSLWEAATGTFRNALAAFGEAAAPQIAELTKSLSVLSEKVMDWAKANPKAAAAIVKLSLGAGALLAVLGAILVPVGLLVGAVGHLISGWAAVSGAFAASGIAVGGLLTPILLLAGAGLLIWKYWEPIKAFLGGMWDGFLAGIAPLMPVLGMLGDTLASILAPAEASSDTLSTWANVGAYLGAMLGTLVTVVIVPLGLALQGLVQIFKFVGERIGATIGFLVTGVMAFGTLLKGVFTLDGPTIMAGFQAIWQNLNQFFGGLPSKLAQVGINMVQGLVNGILSMMGAPGKALAKVADSAIGKLRGLLGIRSPSRVFAELGGFTMQGFTQGLQAGSGGPLGALQRMGAKLRKAGAGIALGTVAAPALANVAPPPPVALPVAPQIQAIEDLQPQTLRILPQLQALNALPALQVDVLPRVQALNAGLLARDTDQEAPTGERNTGPRFDSRPPLNAQAGPAAAGRAGGNTYHFHIAAPPGSDAQEIARLVQEAIERLEHKRRASYRSEMSDYE